ncbi:hypothetical protein RN01_08030 [Cupriavidus sp. SHE]|jgi:Excalibur calcium-binding domain|uniref:Excalibur calcium-binding domain-containing protein n=1 Tax=Cupriavidus metallidurans TaxID=119219 RepID=A0A2L0X1H0_9BURK|nr:MULTISPECIES: excalibur calcium-binding domain-containing protein [Cupriavidus]AVA33932.1 cold-shock protein [Cupriavidus metallidurans]KWR84003.1 hypothetical protein RN01_08030 [Cupriavidus sp. SHE]QBP12713.1 excalibur calcium-binding domain-containing protein [Cupriavidus metallidurans]
MRKLILVAALCAAGYYYYQHDRQARLLAATETVVATETVAAEPSAPISLSRSNPAVQSFSCQGKTRCNEMTSCDEAKFYLQNCPGTKIDGDGDGIPCERTLCGG